MAVDMYLVKMDNLIFPLGPSSFSEEIKDGNETVQLLNGGEIVMPKTPRLQTISMELVLPANAYPFSYYSGNVFQGPAIYIKKLKALKASKKPFLLLVTRKQGNRSLGRNFKMKVVLDSASFSEDPAAAVDVGATLSFTEYRAYKTKKVKLKTKNGKTTKSTKTKRDASVMRIAGSTYTVRKGDTLKGIAKKKTGKSSNWKAIYTANSKAIEQMAKKKGRKSSGNGKWIYAGTKLVIPQLLLPIQKRKG